MCRCSGEVIGVGVESVDMVGFLLEMYVYGGVDVGVEIDYLVFGLVVGEGMGECDIDVYVCVYVGDDLCDCE